MKRSLYMLPFDHRGSFETGLFGWTGALSKEQTAQVAGLKQIIYAAVLEAIGSGVPLESAAILVDEEFGTEILADARKRGITTACPVEESGQAEFEFQYGEDFERHIEAMNPTYSKVLVRYNPEGDVDLNMRQTARLRRLSGYLHHTRRGFLFELLVPPEPSQLERVSGDARAYDLELRPPLMVEAMRELQASGVEPNIWKVEGLDRREDCVEIGKTAQRDGRSGVTCIVLGRHGDEATVRHWLQVAASVPDFIGFAVGRSTFWDPLKKFLAGRMTRGEARAEIALTYRHWVDTWEAASLGTQLISHGLGGP